VTIPVQVRRAAGIEAGVPLTEADAVTAASLWTRTRAAGLSLADRCCLALAARLDLIKVTADTAWASLDIDIPMRIIR
jgi:ribonuclease VapC